MSMNTNVIGIRPADELFQKMKAIWDQCNELRIEVPQEVEKFFAHDIPNPKGVEVEIEFNCVNDDMKNHFIVDLNDIPDDIRFIQFTNSY